MSDFKVGDRVIHTSRKPDDIGAVEKIIGDSSPHRLPRTMLYAVRFHNVGPRFDGTWQSRGDLMMLAPTKAAVVIPLPASLNLLAGNTLSSRPDYTAATRNDEFRSNPAIRTWESSYTKTVVDAVERKLPSLSRSGTVKDALDLLRDYHATQHVVYDQRDQARQKVKQLHELVDELRADTNVLKTEIAMLKTEVAILRDNVSRRDAEVERLKSANAFWRMQWGELQRKLARARTALRM